MRPCTLFLILTLTASTADVAGAEPHPYRNSWKRSAFGAPVYAAVGVRAGFRQLLNSPEEYGGGVSGFAKRLGSGFATHTVRVTVTHLVASKLHEQVHYQRSDDPRFKIRLRHALLSTVVTRNVDTGRNRIAAGNLAGHGASSAMATALFYGSGASTAGIALATHTGFNVVKEFWPPRNKRQVSVPQPTGKRPTNTFVE